MRIGWSVRRRFNWSAPRACTCARARFNYAARLVQAAPQSSTQRSRPGAPLSPTPAAARVCARPRELTALKSRRSYLRAAGILHSLGGRGIDEYLYLCFRGLNWLLSDFDWFSAVELIVGNNVCEGMVAAKWLKIDRLGWLTR